MKIRKIWPAIVVAAGLGCYTPANATIIDQGGTTLDTATGYEWLDLSFTDGYSYDYAVGGVADTQFGGGWVVATRDEVITFWSNITGITTWPVGTWEASLGGGTAIAALVGYTYEFSNYDGIGMGRHMIGYHSGAINVDELYAGSLGLIFNDKQPGQAFGYSKDNYHTKSGSNTNIGTWLVRGDNIRPQVPSGDVDAESVPEPSQAALLLVGLLGVGFVGKRRSRAAVNPG